ncbi:MAG: ATP-binding protein [Planctomycetia bacterium]|nr:ATP-binding protein [Planctomycetia bacterium]
MPGILRIPVPGRLLRDAQAPRGAAGQPLAHFLAPDDDALLAVVARSLLAPPGDDAVRFPGVAIYGPSGTGKTHLAFGLAHLFQRQYPHSAAIYLPAVDLVQACTGPENASRLTDLQEQLRQADLLALDDVARLAGKAKDQEMLARLLDQLDDRGANVICTLTSAPRDCGLLPALESRLAAMLQIALAPPNLDVRCALLLDIAATLDLVLPAETADYLAREVSGTARDLRGLLTHGTLDAIGQYFGGRDHTTVLHGCRRIEELLLQDPCLRQAVERLGRELQGC